MPLTMAGALDLQFAGGLLIHGSALAGLGLFGFHLGLLCFERDLRRLHVLFQRFGFAHQFEDAILEAADFLLAIIDFVLKGAVDFIGLGAEHLVFQLGDLLLL